MVKPYLKNNEKVPPGTGHFPVPTLEPWGQVPPQGHYRVFPSWYCKAG